MDGWMDGWMDGCIPDFYTWMNSTNICDHSHMQELG